MEFDLVTSVNLALSALVVIAGYLAYKKEGNPAWLYLSLAFTLFALSHLVSLLGSAEALYVPMVAVRALAYLLVIFGVHKGITQAAARIPPPAKKKARKK